METKVSVEAEAVAEAGTDPEAEVKVTIKSIKHRTYRPLSLSTIEPIHQRAY